MYYTDSESDLLQKERSHSVSTLMIIHEKTANNALRIPLIRSQKPAEYKAKGVAVGLAWAMTPLVGIHMWLVFMTWVIWKKFSPKGFSLTLGLAWTWVTNVFTMVPAYYMFYVTGQLMMGRFDSKRKEKYVPCSLPDYFIYFQ